MQIFELTQKRQVNEYDPNRLPPKKDYGAGVGPGVQPQMTATPRMKTAPQPGPAPQLPPPNTTTGAVTPAAPSPELQTIDAPPQLTGPKATPAKQIGTNYDPNVIDVEAKPKASAPALPTSSNATAPNAPAAPTATATAPPATTTAPTATPAAPTAAVNPALAAAGKVKMTAAPARGANIGGAIANALMKHNANKVGLGYLLPKDPRNEVDVDSTGKITVDGKPYDANNPAHQRAAGNITVGGKPYDANDPEHRAAYLAFKNTAGQGGADVVKIDANGKVTVAGQPFNPANPSHVMAYRQHMLGSSVAATPPPAQQPAVAGSPDVVQALTGLGYTAQQAAALAAKVPQGTSTEDAVKQILQGRISESLTWSRNFDPSRTLLKKMKSQ